MATIDLAEGDTGSSVPAAVGDEILLTLAESPTSGYRWAFEALDPETLDVVGDDYEPPEPGRLGGEGHRRWRLQARAEGSSWLRLVLRRAWDAESVVSSFEATIVVRRAVE